VAPPPRSSSPVTGRAGTPPRAAASRAAPSAAFAAGVTREGEQRVVGAARRRRHFVRHHRVDRAKPARDVARAAARALAASPRSRPHPSGTRASIRRSAARSRRRRLPWAAAFRPARAARESVRDVVHAVEGAAPDRRAPPSSVRSVKSRRSAEERSSYTSWRRRGRHRRAHAAATARAAHRHVQLDAPQPFGVGGQYGQVVDDDLPAKTASPRRRARTRRRRRPVHARGYFGLGDRKRRDELTSPRSRFSRPAPDPFRGEYDETERNQDSFGPGQHQRRDARISSVEPTRVR